MIYPYYSRKIRHHKGPAGKQTKKAAPKGGSGRQIQLVSFS